MTNTEKQDFIKRIAPIIQKEAQKRGYKVASPIIAQACLESAYGSSKLASKDFNYFGMKCGSSWKGERATYYTKEEYKKGTLTTVKADFRKYKNMEEGIKGYFDFISTSRYKNLIFRTTPEQYLNTIKNAGYATSSTYIKSNMDIIKLWSLTKYDNFNGESERRKGTLAFLVDGTWCYFTGECITRDGIDYAILKKAVTGEEVEARESFICDSAISIIVGD